MIKAERKENDFEILISTMQRTNFSFLSKMFPSSDFSSYNILIINQTEKGKELISTYKNVKVVNAYEKGLSLSRNLAIKHATGRICLFADDDIKYKNDFKEIIMASFDKKKDADIITFQMEDDKGQLFKAYPNIEWHNQKTLLTVNSVVIAFRRSRVLRSGIRFNINFGLGAIFPTADEYIFLRDALKENIKIYFERAVILTHNYFSSGRVMGSDPMVFARSALIYKYSGSLTYLKLIKYLYHAFMAHEIKLNEFGSKYMVGIKGIYHYKELIKKGIEKR
ncbi:glycosyltransferase family A protein [Aestuariivivens marinum]|uniref:glycosyltransferase family A protein n=1 Tax=Aestuariivivens marinum TaxID=2913555 RepID=UPI001F5841E6|nr:glycosyltransferase family 2 protein [Aestuariivivens marinum]